MQAANQFTPDQLIVAGRRAEAQGQPAYALQFYRYVADHFPASTEAYEARDALFRLTPAENHPPSQRGPATGYGAQPQQPQQPQAAYAPSHHATPAQPTLGASSLGQATLGDVRPQHGPASAPRVRTERAKTKPRAAEAEAYEAPTALPARGYRIGRIVAAMLNTIGWLCLLGAIVMIPIMIAALTLKAFPKGIKENIASNLLMVGGSTFGLLLIGLFAVFAAQVARATFDTADATRALLEANTGGE